VAVPSVRLALSSDARAIAHLSRDTIEHGLVWTYTEQKILQAIRDRSTNVAVMDQQERCLAFGIMHYAETSAHLVLLGVRPAQRRRGLGRTLVEWLEDSAIVAGIEHVRVEVRADNPSAIAFYQRLGYTFRVRFPGYYQGSIDAVVLAKRLRAGYGASGI
jgi:[ribosomal protein S18]-alanine N-acetyltransferase